MRGKLDTFVAEIQAAWGPLDSDLVGRGRQALEALAKTPADEPWLARLLADAPASAAVASLLRILY